MKSEYSLPAPSEVSRKQTWAFSRGVATLFGALYVFYALTLDPPLSPPSLIFFTVLSVTLAIGYLLLTPRGLTLPRGPGAPVRIQFPLLTVAWALAFFLVLRGETAIYFHLALFDEYISLALFHSRRWAFGWVGALGSVMTLAHWSVFGWPEALSPLLDTLPTYLLVCGVAELVVRLWEAREKAETLTTQLRSAYQQLQDYTSKAETLAVSQERARLAHEIHDSMGHTLTALGIQLELLHRLPADQDEARRQALERARRLAVDAQVEVWRAVQALCPPPLETLALPEAMTQLVEDFVQRAKRPVTWEIQGQQRPLPASSALALYRALQEALTNVQRHAPDAKQVTATLRYGDQMVWLNVENGASGETPVTAFKEGFGLRGLRERAESLGGDFRASPTPEGGFRLTVGVPLPPPET